VYGLAIWSISLVIIDCPISGYNQGHASIFYILDLANVATASLRCIGVVNKARQRSACGLHLYDGQARHGWLHKFIIRWSTVTPKLCYFNLFWTCRTSCSYTVMQQLAWFFSDTLRRAIFTFCGSRASCYACYSWPSFDLPQAALQYVMYFQLSGQRHTCTRWPRIGDAKKAYTKNDSPWATLDRGGVDVYDCLILVLYHLQ